MSQEREELQRLAAQFPAARWQFEMAVEAAALEKLIRGVGFPPAFVAQDGLTVNDVPWGEAAALFIGGHTEWKLGPHAAQLIGYAKARGLWVHMGRVNSQTRIWDAFRKGVDSFDGSKYSRWSDRWIPEAERTLEATRSQPRLAI